jgi:hypothetical protein
VTSTELAFPDDIFDIKQLEERQNVLIYGPPGIGKSVLAGGAGLIIAVQPSGPVSAKRMGSQAKIWPAPEWPQFEAAVEWLERAYADGHRPFEWIAVDTADAMQMAMMRWILEEAQRENSKRDLDRPEIQDHFKWQQMFLRFILRLNDLPCNVLYLANEIRFENSEGDELRIPGFEGKRSEGYKISSRVCAEMDSVGYMELADANVKREGKIVKVKRRRVRFAPTAGVYAKDRSGNVSPHWWVTNLADLHELMTAPAKGAKPMPLAGVAVRIPDAGNGASVATKALPAPSTPATPAPAAEAIEDAELLEDLPEEKE